MASPLPSYPPPGPSSFYPQPPPPPVPPPFIYDNHNPAPYPYQYPPSHLNSNAHQPTSPRAMSRQPHGAYIASAAGPSYQNYHHPTPQHFPHPTSSHPYAHQHSKYPHPQPAPYSSPYGAHYSPAWSTQQPLSPLPKQLSMPPPQILSSPPPTHPPPPNPPPSIAVPTTPTKIPSPPFADPSSPRPSLIHQPKPSTNSSPPLTSPPLPDIGGWAIWSRRPHDPSRAPGIIISPLARPPPDIVQHALDLPTPPASPKPLPIPSTAKTTKILESKAQSDLKPPESLTPERDASERDVTSSSVTAETTPACSTSPDTSIPGSPQSTNTSVSLAGTSSGKAKTASSPPTESVLIPAESNNEPVEREPPSPPSPPPVKKTWASLLRPTTLSSASSPQKPNFLPTSSVVGISIPASAPLSLASVPPSKKSELLGLLTGATALGTTSDSKYSFCPRGLLNSGNMCFANAVLQVMLYCPPFHRLFSEFGRILGGATFASIMGKERVAGGTPLVDATIQFLREFALSDGSRDRGEGHGKGKEVDKRGRGEGEEENMKDAFIPTYVYDALKEKKRFDNMRGGHQEDAEEFFGFYLDTLEEELLSIVSSLSPSRPTKGAQVNGQAEEREEEVPPLDEGWLEVGRRNRTVVTRTIKTAESPITRIFGGKFRSTLRASGQKDSVIVEDWRAVRLDIQREQIHTIQDAMTYISSPQSVQVTFPTRPGVTVDASQQVLIEALPPILVLHMKRFLYDTGVGGVVKVNRQVRFGPELEIVPEVMAPALRKSHSTKYKLFGVLYHHGLSASGGHYTLDVLHPDRFPSPSPGLNGKPHEGWVRLDDEVVSDIKSEDVFGGFEREDRCAYLLFYTRVGSGRSGG